MAKFKVGELAKLVPLKSNTRLGEEIAKQHGGKIVEINAVQTYPPLGCSGEMSWQWYGITIDDDPSYYAAEHILHPLPPPKSEDRDDLQVVEWDKKTYIPKGLEV